MIISDNKRLQWIDVARGLAILLVIIGHTVPFESFTRVIIYSVHMPIFFILSGYTFRCSKNYEQFSRHVYKSVLKFILPCVFMQLMCEMVYIIKDTKISFGDCLSAVFFKLYYGRSIEVLWFLIALFWGRIIFDGMQLTIKKNTWIAYFFLCILGIELGKINIMFPQNFDLALVIPIFMWTGKLLKNNIDSFEKNKLIILVTCFLIWLICVMKGMHIELAVRFYPLGIICVIEAICGSVCFLALCKNMNFKITNKLSVVGESSFIIFMVHNLGMNFLMWDSFYLNSESILTKFFIIGSRVIIEVGISIFIVYFYKKAKDGLMLSNSFYKKENF